MLRTLALFAAAVSSGLAAVVEKNWDVEWVSAAPDGYARPVIGASTPVQCARLIGAVSVRHLT